MGMSDIVSVVKWNYVHMISVTIVLVNVKILYYVMVKLSLCMP
jgi:hypothetical protein